MNIIGRHIRHLLLGNGIVAVPGLGTFAMIESSAQYCEATDIFTPPSVTVAFTYIPGCADDDLSESVSRASGLPLNESRSIVEREVDMLINALSESGNCTLPGVGRICMSDKDGAIGFDADKYLTSGHPCSWLPSLEMSALPVTAAKERENEDTSETEAYRESMLRSLRRTASSAAAFALFAILAFVASQLPGRHSEPKTASIGIEHIAAAGEDRIGYEIPESGKALVIVLNTPSDGMCVVEPSPAKEAVAENSQNDKYFLVVASLASREEAAQFISYSNRPLSLLENDGRYRVYALSGSSVEDVKNRAEAASLYEKYPSAWICRK